MGDTGEQSVALYQYSSIICWIWKTQVPILCAWEIAQLVKNPSAMQETPVWSLGWEDLLEKGKATHSSILA